MMGRLHELVTTPAAPLWAAVDALIDRAPSLDGLRAHKLHLLAARRLRAAGHPVPAALALDERRSAVNALTAPALLRRVRAAVDGPIVLIKGPEVAARYPDPVLRPYGDLDLIVPDAAAAQRALLADGFVAIGDPRLYGGIHHERPLTLPGLPIWIELHSCPKWPEGLTPPPPEELFEAAVPSATGVDGVSAPDPAQHALILAAHSWAHDPLRRVGELVDVAAVSDGIDDATLRALAASWELRGVWRTTERAAAALTGTGRTTLPLRTWARHLPAMRERTVLETHLDRWLSGFWGLPAGLALASTRSAAAGALSPADGEPPAAKRSRTRRALADAFVAQSRHADEIDKAGLRAPLFYELGDGGDGEPRPGPVS
jgi:hypothetical protein